MFNNKQDILLLSRLSDNAKFVRSFNFRSLGLFILTEEHASLGFDMGTYKIFHKEQNVTLIFKKKGKGQSANAFNSLNVAFNDE